MNPAEKAKGGCAPDLFVQIYTPDRQAGWGPRVWREMAQEASSSRELSWRLFMRDFSAKYRQSVLGVLWALILPLIAVGTFIFLNRSGLLNVGETGVPYPVFALLGLTVWQVFAGGVTLCSNALVSAGSIVVKINFSKETLIVAAMGQVLFELFVRLILVGLLMAFYQVAPRSTVFLLPLTLLPMVLLTMGMGFMLSLVNIVYRDTSHIVTVSTPFLMFLTPVVYPAPKAGMLAKIMSFNPLAPLVTATRDVIYSGYLSDPFGFAWAASLSFIFFLFAWRVFHLVEFKMAEVI